MPESDPEKRRQWEQREKEETSCVASFMGPQMTDVVIWFSICTPAYCVRVRRHSGMDTYNIRYCRRHFGGRISRSPPSASSVTVDQLPGLSSAPV